MNIYNLNRYSLFCQFIHLLLLGQVLSLGYVRSLATSLDKLEARLGLSEAQLQKLVVALPQVLGYSFEANVAPSLAKLQARLSAEVDALSRQPENSACADCAGSDSRRGCRFCSVTLGLVGALPLLIEGALVELRHRLRGG